MADQRTIRQTRISVDLIVELHEGWDIRHLAVGDTTERYLVNGENEVRFTAADVLDELLNPGGDPPWTIVYPKGISR